MRSRLPVLLALIGPMLLTNTSVPEDKLPKQVTQHDIERIRKAKLKRERKESKRKSL